MTTLKAIERQYSALTPDERFRLVALAYVRGDAADVRRLVDACPRFTYSMADTAYQDRVRGMFDVCEAVAVVLRGIRADARVAGVVERAAADFGEIAGQLCELAYRHGYEDAGGGGEPDTSGSSLRAAGEGRGLGAHPRAQ